MGVEFYYKISFYEGFEYMVLDRNTFFLKLEKEYGLKLDKDNSNFLETTDTPKLERELSGQDVKELFELQKFGDWFIYIQTKRNSSDDESSEQEDENCEQEDENLDYTCNGYTRANYESIDSVYLYKGTEIYSDKVGGVTVDDDSIEAVDFRLEKIKEDLFVVRKTFYA